MAYKRISPMPIAEGGTNATTMVTTDGVVYFDGTSLVTTTAGVATQVLTSNGPGVAPTFQPGGGGGGGDLTLIQTHTIAAPVATVDFTTGFTHDFYFLEITDASPSTNNTDVLIQLSVDGGASWQNFPAGLMQKNNLGTGVITSVVNQSVIGTKVVNISTVSATLNANLYLNSSTALNLVGDSFLTGQTMFLDITAGAYFGTNIFYTAGLATAGVSVNGIRIVAAAGNIESGEFSLYGYKS